MPTATILIVTENTTVASDLSARLAKLGYRVFCSKNKTDALKMVGEVKPDVLLIDTATGSIAQINFDLPVIYVTGSIGQATIRRTKSLGTFGYIYQPFEDQQLLVSIETALTRHHMEKKIRDSRQWLNTTLNSIGDGIIATDEKGLVQIINPAAVYLTGWKLEDAIGKPLQEVFLLSEQAARKFLDIAKIQIIKKIHFEETLHTRNNRSIPTETVATIITGENGETLGMVLVFRDTTMQTHALQEIQRQAERAETLLQVVSQMNTDIELETVLREICLAATRTLKSNGTSILLKDPKRDVLQSVAITGDEQMLKKFQKEQLEIPSVAFESLAGSADSSVLVMDANAYPNSFSVATFAELNILTILVAPLQRQGKTIGFLMSFFSSNKLSILDDEKKLLKGLADQAAVAIANASSYEQVRASRERQQLLTRKLVEVQENERRSLARELHDEIGQMLTGLQFTIKWLMANSNEEQKNRLEQVQIIISATISQIRELSINLRPSLLDDLGLLPTLEWYLDRYEATTGVEVRFNHVDLNQRFNTELETAAFRIVQEALTNVARYAESETVNIRIDVMESVMKIEITDTGLGFDLAGLSRKKSVGIEGMRERAFAIGGVLEIDSQLGKGTSVRATLPISGYIERRANERDHPAGR